MSLSPRSPRRLLDAVTEAAPLALFELAPDGTVVLSAGSALERIAGRSVSAVGRSMFDLYREVPSVLAAVRRALGGEALVDTSWVPSADGEEEVYRMTYVPVAGPQGAVERVIGIVLDITEQARAARRLEHMETRLRRLGLRSQAEHEADRHRITREIHDTLGQELTALRFDARTAARRAAAGDTEGTLAQLREVDDAVDRVLVAVQRVTDDLRPPSLDERGLRAALAEAVRRCGTRTGITHSFASSVPARTLKRLPRALETAVYRVTQEALENVSRHSGAQSVQVRLDGEAGRTDDASLTLRLEITDDGRGLGAGAEGDALGLLGMRERAAEWGGDLTVTSDGGDAGVGLSVAATFVVSAGDLSAERRADDRPYRS